MTDSQLEVSVQMRLNMIRNSRLVALEETYWASRRSRSKGGSLWIRSIWRRLAVNVRDEVCQAPRGRHLAFVALLSPPATSSCVASRYGRGWNRSGPPLSTILHLTSADHPLHSSHSAIFETHLDASWVISSGQDVLHHSLILNATFLVGFEDYGYRCAGKDLRHIRYIARLPVVV